jgi:iron complex transport system ATP-binding protein
VAKPLAGDVLVDGCSLRTLGHAERARRIASVSHERGAPGGLTSREAVALGRHPHTGWSGHLDVEDQRIVDEAIERVGAGPLADRLVDELSDGERQRVSIARALAQEASVLILDEPTAFLDVTGRVRTMQLAHDLARTASIAVVIATHDLELTLPVVDRIWAVRGGVLHDGTLADLAAAGRLSDVFDTPIHHDTSTDAVRITVPR